MRQELVDRRRYLNRRITSAAREGYSLDTAAELRAAAQHFAGLGEPTSERDERGRAANLRLMRAAIEYAESIGWIG